MIPSKPKVLAILQLPPPVHGASVMNRAVVDSRLLNKFFDIECLPLYYSTKLKDISRFHFNKLIITCRLIIKIIKCLKNNRYELIYFTISPTGYAFYRDAIFTFILKAFGAKILFHLHGKGIQNSLHRNRIQYAICRYVFKNTDVIVLSGQLANDLDNISVLNIHTINNGIEIDAPQNLKIKRFDESINILFLSNLIRNKGIFVFIEALITLRKVGIPFKASIVGNESKSVSIVELKNMLKKSNIDQYVSIKGPKYGHDKSQIIHNADIFCLPTLNEAFPLVLLEAMQHGKAIISTKEGAIPEIIKDKFEGILVDKNDAKQLSNALIELIENEKLRNSMGHAAKNKFLTSYTLDIFEHKMLDVFLQVCKSI